MEVEKGIRGISGNGKNTIKFFKKLKKENNKLHIWLKFSQCFTDQSIHNLPSYLLAGHKSFSSLLDKNHLYLINFLHINP